MIISSKIYLEIKNNLPDNPPEIGGLLGGQNGVITVAELDQGLSKSMCTYIPDVNRLNEVIKIWNLKRINFFGIFHTHFFSVEALSEPDKDYIKEILNAMPEYITRLYFPIAVLPERKLIPYIAIRQKPDVLIKADKLIIQ